MTKREQIEQIHESFINGQHKQAVQQINDFNDMYEFWSYYKKYLDEVYLRSGIKYKYFTNHVIIYHRITYK